METRGWADERGETYHMRAKETSDDYRYFPEPDLPPLRVEAAWLAEIRAALPELPAARRARYQDVLGLSAYDAAVLVADADAGRLFEATLAAAPGLEAKPVANWVTGDYLRIRNAASRRRGGRPGRARRPRPPSSPRARSRAPTAGGPRGPRRHPAVRSSAIVAGSGLRQISDAGALGPVVDSVLAANPAAVADVRAGKPQAIGFLVGQVMKATRGQANAAVVQAAIRDRLGAGRGEAA